MCMPLHQKQPRNKEVKKMKKQKWTLFFGLVLLAIWMIGPHEEVVEAQSIEDYVGPEICQSCHAPKVEDWEESGHSEAFTNQEFQDEWDSEGNPDTCLECHTTGYDPSSGEFAYEGVSCEACHGAGLTMEVDRSPELCGSCHTGEFGNNRYEDFVEGTHFNSGVTCADCHVSEGDHTFELQSSACATCHTENRIHSSSLIGDAQTRALNAEDRIIIILEENERVLEQLTDVESRTSMVYLLTYGGVGALVTVVAVTILLYMRQKKSS